MATHSKQPKRVKMNADELAVRSRSKLAEKFGPRTALGKHDIRGEGKWQVLTFAQIGQYTIHGKGSTAHEAMADAGLGEWVEDLERGIVEE